MERDDFDWKTADLELTNWGRFVHDGWLADHLLYANPPTSDGYIAPVTMFDEPEPAKAPIDEQQALATEKIVVHIGLTHFESFQVLQHWYTRIMRAPLYSIENRRDFALKQLSKKMRTHPEFAKCMLDSAQYLYWLHRELVRLTPGRKFANIDRGL